MRFAIPCLVLAMLVSSSGRCLGADTLDAMLARVPEKANTLTIVYIDALRKTPVALREGWAKRREVEWLAGSVSLPPTARLAVIATQFTPGSMKNDWELSQIEFDKAFNMYEVGKREGMDVEFINGQKSVRSRRDFYACELTQFNMGVASPAKRQEVARWLKFAKENKKPVVSEHLLKAATEDTRGAHIVMAMDVTDAPSYSGVRQRLLTATALKDKNVNLDTLAKFITGIKGVRLAVTADSGFTGELRLDFADSVEPFSAYFVPLLTEVLDDFGLAPEHFSFWKPRMKGTSVTLGGKLSEDDVKKYLALVLPPNPALDNDDAPTEAGDKKALASQRYFRVVNGLVDDLKKTRKRYEEKSTAASANAPTAYKLADNAVVHDNCAKKIAQLPILDVDEELAQYAMDVSARLRAMAESLRGVKIQDNVLESHRQSSAYSYGGYGYGYTEYYTNAPEIRAKKAENAAAGQGDRLKIWSQIDNDTAAMRVKMTERYKIEF